MEEFGKKLSGLRTEQNMTLKDVAHRVSIPESRLLELERGVRIPSDGQVKRLESFFGLGSGDLASLLSR
jgi:transcriptional regulator with XRE-family HTH domain